MPTSHTPDSYQRWEVAQTYERAWWEQRAEGMNAEFYKNYALDIIAQLASWITLTDQSAILEIGSGAAGIVTHLPGKKRCAVDPLEGYYGSVEHFRSFRDPKVSYATARGEELPFNDGEFDLVLTDNVLDHCEEPAQVLREAHRVLRDGGILFLRLHVYQTWGRWVRLAIEKLQIDEGHPFTFTRESLDALVAQSGYECLEVEGESYLRAWWHDLTRGSVKGLAKALALSPRSRTHYVLRKSRTTS